MGLTRQSSNLALYEIPRFSPSEPAPTLNRRNPQLILEIVANARLIAETMQTDLKKSFGGWCHHYDDRWLHITADATSSALCIWKKPEHEIEEFEDCDEPEDREDSFEVFVVDGCHRVSLFLIGDGDWVGHLYDVAKLARRAKEHSLSKGKKRVKASAQSTCLS
jgi:hypothetical protein